MDLRQRENLLSKILSGNFYEVEGKLLHISIPNKQDVYWANKLYEDVKYKALYENFYTQEDIQLILSNLNLWNDKKEKELKDTEHNLEDLKVRIYLDRLNPKQVKLLTKAIEGTIVQITKYYESKHFLDHLLAESYAAMCRRQYLICQSLVDEKGHKFLNDKESDFNLLEEVFNFIRSQQASVAELRDLARNEPWRSYWDISKPKCFKQHYEDWTEEQKLLVKYSKMYDNIFKHPECPGEDVINNDYMLDGWVIHINREREQEKKNQGRGDPDKVGQGALKHQEQFIVAANPEHAKNIQEMNSEASKAIQRERQKVIDKKGKVKELDLPDMNKPL